MKPSVALIDVDEVLYDFIGELARVASTITGLDLSNYPTAEVWDVFVHQWGITNERHLELVAEGVSRHGLLAGGLPLPGAQVGWRALRERLPHVRLHIVTNVGHGDTAEQAMANRRDWLARWGFDFDDITFTNDKADVALEYLHEGFTVATIDDFPDHFIQYRNVGASSYLAHHRWNRGVSTMGFRVSDLDAFASRVAREVFAHGSPDDSDYSTIAG